MSPSTPAYAHDVPRTAAIYLRISKDEEGLGLAIDRQREDCVKLAQQRGWTVTKEYVDQGISASKRTVTRPAYNAMVEDFEAGMFNAIVTYDLDRLTRQPRQLEDWVDAAQERDLVIVTANGDADLGTDAGRMFARVKAAVARSEIERKGARQRRANEQRAAAGKPHLAKRPFGWEPRGEKVRESEAAAIRQGFQIILSGGSVRSVAREWQSAGVLTATGRKEWSPIQVKKVLLRERNAGILVRLGEVVSEESTIEPIVTVKDFETLSAILSDPSRDVTGGRDPIRSWLSGLLTCSVCGSKMLAKTITSKSVKRRYYLCGAKMAGTTEPGTRHPSVAADIAEEHVEARLHEDFYSGRFFLADPDTTLEAQEAIAENRRKRSTLTELATMPGADLAVIRRQLGELSEEAERLEKRKGRNLADEAFAWMLHSYFGEDEEPSLEEWAAWPVEDFTATFHRLDIEKRRSIIRGAYRVMVLPTERGGKAARYSRLAIENVT